MDAADLARIRFVTARYRELQGLRNLAVVPGCLLLFWFRPYLRLLRYAGPFEALAGLFLSVLPCLLVVMLHPLLDRYYARRFGSVASPGPWSRDMVAWAGLLGIGVWIDTSNFGTPQPSATLIAGGMVALHIAVRDWPWRRYYLGTAVICGAAAWLTAVTPALHADDLTSYLRIPLTMLLSAHAVAAFLDHRLLVRALPMNPDGHAEALVADHADPI